MPVVRSEHPCVLCCRASECARHVILRSTRSTHSRAGERLMSVEMTGKSVLVTGAGGVIGSHLTEALVHAGARGRALVHYNPRSDWGYIESLDPRAREALEGMAGGVRGSFRVRQAAERPELV